MVKWKKENRSLHGGFETWVLYDDGVAVGKVYKTFREPKTRNGRSWAASIPVYVGVTRNRRLRDAKKDVERSVGI